VSAAKDPLKGKIKGRKDYDKFLQKPSESVPEERSGLLVGVSL
jgi:hypothetical protein